MTHHFITNTRVHATGFTWWNQTLTFTKIIWCNYMRLRFINDVSISSRSVFSENASSYYTIFKIYCSFTFINLLYNPTGTPRRIHVDSTWILHWYVKDQISTNFPAISAYFFDVILLVEKFTGFPRTFFQCNLDGRKIYIVSRYLYWCNFDGRNMHFAFTCFFQCNFDVQRFGIVFGKL